MKQRIFAFWRSFLLCVIILILCLIPGDSMESLELESFSYFDKFAHFIMHFALMSTMLHEKQISLGLNDKLKNLHLFLFSGLLGACIEFLQWSSTADRSGEIIDLLFNLAGAAIAIPAYRYGLDRLLNRIDFTIQKVHK